jgi:hypothetical protein
MILNTIIANWERPWFSGVFFVALPLFVGAVFSLLSILLCVKNPVLGQGRLYTKPIFLIAAMLGCFSLCWGPSTIYFYIEINNVKNRGEHVECDQLNYIFYIMTSFTVALQPGFNPMLYWWFSSDFQRDVKKLKKRLVGFICKNFNMNVDM